jgi:hypothetical protein
VGNKGFQICDDDRTFLSLFLFYQMKMKELFYFEKGMRKFFDYQTGRREMEIRA